MILMMTLPTSTAKATKKVGHLQVVVVVVHILFPHQVPSDYRAERASHIAMEAQAEAERVQVLKGALERTLLQSFIAQAPGEG